MESEIDRVPQTPPVIMPRKLRIAASIFFGLLTVALCVLWVRSYWRCDAIYGPLFNTHTFNLSACWGRVRFATFDRTYEGQFSGERLEGWGRSSSQIDRPPSLTLVNTPLTNLGLGFADSRDRYGIVAIIPFYILAATASVLAYAPWLPLRRFSLRTLLIATTLVAIVLGLGVWLTR